MRWMSARGTLPIRSQRSWMFRRSTFAAAMSVTGTSRSACSSSASLASRFAENSASVCLKWASRATKKASCAARKRAQRASSSLRLARPAVFHRAIRSRNAADVPAQSVLVASASAWVTSCSFSVRAAELDFSSSANQRRRSRSKVDRAWLNRFQRTSSLVRSRRGPRRCASFHCSRRIRSCSPAGRHCMRSGSVAAIFSAASTIAVRASSPTCLAAARSASATAFRAAASILSTSRRRRRPSRSPTAAGASSSDARCSSVASISLTDRSVAVIRASKSTTLACRSAKRRT